jgi:hypothetical protein
LLLALGKSVESPVRVMDEIDVFLDANARRTAFQQIIQHAKSLRRQYIIFTPQEIDTIREDPNLVRKCKIKPGENYQVRRLENTTLDKFLGKED